uniref:Ig-like domain-containing protein n=1 Tax=Neogobius melanostomus TaxID=47308 RepID=A0A8C6UXY4_9GOBI
MNLSISTFLHLFIYPFIACIYFCISTFIHFCISVFLCSCMLISVELLQPGSVLLQPAQTLSISCRVSGYSLTDGYATAWIRQPAGKGLEWIGQKYTGGSHYKESLKSKFSIDLDTSSNTVTLTGNNMQPGDTAVYFCARRAQSLREYEELNKNTSGMSQQQPQRALYTQHDLTKLLCAVSIYFLHEPRSTTFGLLTQFSMCL